MAYLTTNHRHTHNSKSKTKYDEKISLEYSCDNKYLRKEARINLVKATCQVIKNSLALIGIEVVDKM